GSAALAVSLLVVGVGDHGLDTAVAKVSADRAGRIRLIAADRVRSGPRPADVTPHLQPARDECLRCGGDDPFGVSPRVLSGASGRASTPRGRGPPGPPLRPGSRRQTVRSRPCLRPQRPCANGVPRSEEHTSELQSRENLVCRLLLEKKKK